MYNWFLWPTLQDNMKHYMGLRIPCCHLHIFTGEVPVQTTFNSMIDPPPLQKNKTTTTKICPTKTSWWLNQPIWNICSSNWVISPGRDESKQMFETTTQKQLERKSPGMWVFRLRSWWSELSAEGIIFHQDPNFRNTVTVWSILLL